MEGEKKRDERGTREEREERRRDGGRRRNETLGERRKKDPAYPATEIHDFKSRHTMETVNDVSEIERGITRARRREKIVRTGENDDVERAGNARRAFEITDLRELFRELRAVTHFDAFATRGPDENFIINICHILFLNTSFSKYNIN